MDPSSNIVHLFTQRVKPYPQEETLEKRLPTYENVIGILPHLNQHTLETPAEILQFPKTSLTLTEKNHDLHLFGSSIGMSLWSLASVLHLRAGVLAHYAPPEHLALPFSVLSDERFYFSISLGAAAVACGYACKYIQSKF